MIGFCVEHSEKEGAQQIAHMVRHEGWEALTVPIKREFVHADGLFVPLDEKLLVSRLATLEPWVID